MHEGGDYVDDQFPYDTDESGGSTGDSRLQDSPWNGSTLEPNSQTVDQFRAKWGVPDMLGTTSVTALEQTARQQGNYYYLTSSSTAAVATPNVSGSSSRCWARSRSRIVSTRTWPPRRLCRVIASIRA